MVLGGDGYIGWSYGLHRALGTDDRVILVDSYLKRSLQKKVGVEEIYPMPYLTEKVAMYRRLAGKTNLESVCLDVANYGSIGSYIERIKPDVILNAAQQPSAPLSMMSPGYASLTLTNNQQTTLNVLWAVSASSRSTKVIDMGSAGAYLSIDADLIPSRPVDLFFWSNGKKHERCVSNTWLPMQSSDFYHQSKVISFGITELCSKVWGLDVITVQQSTVCGQCAADDLPPELYSRLNYDHIFGTVLNRFVCQAVTGNPITVYGDGKNRTNLISLCDTVKTIDSLVDGASDVKGHTAVNSFTHTLSILEIAEMVARIYGRGQIQHIANPRKEATLIQEKAFESNVLDTVKGDLDACVQQTIDFVNRFKYNINSNLFSPMVSWCP